MSFDFEELVALIGLELSRSKPRANALSTKTNMVQEELHSEFKIKTLL